MIGAEMTAVRERLGLTQEQLAEELGVHVRTIGRWENDERKISEVVARLLAKLEEGA